MPPRLKDKVQQAPHDRNRIVIEGLDDRLDTGERGRFQDRIKIDPFTPRYSQRHVVPTFAGQLKRA